MRERRDGQKDKHQKSTSSGLNPLLLYQTDYLTSLGLNVVICQMGMMIVPNSYYYFKDDMNYCM